MSARLKEKIMSMFTQKSIAKKLGCRQQTVSLWLNKGVPDGKVLLFSEALNWRVTPHEIRPDMYPGICDGLPDSMRNPRQITNGALKCDLSVYKNRPRKNKRRSSPDTSPTGENQ
ncbi:hypothetical protein DOH76_12115 [Salmonella enterica subsp. enterica serovar Oranienburg]|nr:hypothetical protein [Salmonella enterica]EBG5026293.1 helix-turn-helix domain-containing protein [Salmonella enterica subsp. enterica serovar Oranienburg]EAS1262605.1 helix-turn-helix domain-containing protein [Salmonella enterica]EBB1604407.1 helix-turn-helix domain-containing protein [Salmonella enterica]EBB9533810.1 helix-turn-helix domain-containing protein [Salmonella enterica]